MWCWEDEAEGVGENEMQRFPMPSRDKKWAQDEFVRDVGEAES